MPNYSAQKIVVDGFEVVRLTDSPHKTEVSILPSIGNFAYEMKVNGHNIFWWPYQSLADFKAKPGFAGVPFLAPWANRLDQDAFWANGKKYILNPDLGNLRRDQNSVPIHGLLSYAEDWHVVALKADGDAAEVTSRLEFTKRPEWMAQFPFAQTIEMTFRLSGGALEVKTVIENQSDEPMPLSIGYHPYYQITDAPRDKWTVHLAAKDHYELSNKLIPTGVTKPIDLPDPFSLAGHQLDDVYGSVNHDDDFWVQGAKQKISIRYGRKFPIAVVYAPPGKDFICFEPMTGITDAFNLAHDGIYKDLQSVPAGGSWQESFWIKPSGF
jgi:aldose 1-epimerase